MYGLAGTRRLTELELPWLAGYEGSVPVRIGNAASEQFQLDVYGEVLDMDAIADFAGWEVVRWLPGDAVQTSDGRRLGQSVQVLRRSAKLG